MEAADRYETRLAELLPAVRPATGRLRLALAGSHRREAARAAVTELRELTAEAAGADVPLRLAQATADLLREPASEIESWVDFEVRSAEYYSRLAEICAHPTDVAATEGFVPSEVAERVHAQPLDDTHRRVSLRGYQAFGARFALAQRRVVLGDEMGLGKTVQAIAVLAHLAAEGYAHFLVVCPAGVLINWTREIRARSTLRAVPVHGPERRDAYAEWRERGGVAVTTFDVLHTLPEPEATSRPGGGPGAPPPGLLVVDEAHYVKNPDTRRARSVAVWTGACERVLFLTGTPMENRVEEFRALVRHLRPELVPEIRDSAAAAGPHAFRKAVAPAYLRRNQKDVLTELPALIQVDEWEEFSAADRDAYREAVAAGNFMAMRRAAYAYPEKSAKLQRLRELVAEAAANGLKAVVFSYFRDVLRAVQDTLGDGVFGPISGDVPAARRQRLVDDFTAAEGTRCCSARSRRAVSDSTSRPRPWSSCASRRSSRPWSTRPWPARTAWARSAPSRCTGCWSRTAWTTVCCAFSGTRTACSTPTPAAATPRRRPRTRWTSPTTASPAASWRRNSAGWPGSRRASRRQKGFGSVTQPAASTSRERRCRARKPKGRSKRALSLVVIQRSRGGAPPGAKATAVTAAARKPSAPNSAIADCRADATASGKALMPGKCPWSASRAVVSPNSSCRASRSWSAETPNAAVVTSSVGGSGVMERSFTTRSPGPTSP